MAKNINEKNLQTRKTAVVSARERLRYFMAKNKEKQRNLVRKESRRLERKQQCEVAKTCKTKAKKFWKYVRSKRENRGGIGDIKAKDEQGNEVTITQDKEKAEMFARYFSAVFTQESSESFRQISAVKISIPMQDIHVTREQIQAKLKSLNTDN